MNWELQDMSTAYEHIFQMFLDKDDPTHVMYIFKGGHSRPRQYHVIIETAYGDTKQ